MGPVLVHNVELKADLKSLMNRWPPLPGLHFTSHSTHVIDLLLRKEDQLILANQIY